MIRAAVLGDSPHVLHGQSTHASGMSVAVTIPLQTAPGWFSVLRFGVATEWRRSGDGRELENAPAVRDDVPRVLLVPEVIGERIRAVAAH